MTLSISAAARTARMNALVTQLGASATIKFYNGTKPASLGAVTTQTLLATLTFGTDVLAANGGTAGSCTGGVLTFGGVTQTAASHVAGTPTWARLSTSGGTVVADVDIGAGAGNIQFTGAVATGQNITGSLAMTDGNP